MSAGSVEDGTPRYLPYWRLDGHLPPPHSRGAVIGLGSGGISPETAIRLHLTLQAIKRSEKELSFSNIAIPDPSKQLTLHQKPDGERSQSA